MSKLRFFKLNLFSWMAVLVLVGWFGLENIVTHRHANRPLTKLESTIDGSFPATAVIRYYVGWPIPYKQREIPFGISAFRAIQLMSEISYARLSANIALLFLTTASAVFVCQYWFKNKLSIRSLFLLTAIAALLLASFKIGELRKQLFFAPVALALLTLGWIALKKYFFQTAPQQAT